MSWDRLSKRKSIGGMGFQNIHDFNVAKVGKQGWRLKLYQNILVAQVYKARYHPNPSFLSAKIGGNPSHIWSSIIAS